MKNKITTLILVIFCSLASMAQVGIGTNSPNANAALDVVSTTQGILLPRMTTAQRNAISSPAEGLTIFNTTTNAMQTNIGTTNSPSWRNWYNGGQLGSTYTAYSNGSENFSANGWCTSKLISAQGCGGLTSVTGASGTVYNLVDINGQCWMKTNLNEVPSNFSGPPTWVNTTDVGWSGYYNNASGPVTGYGRLYQWSAAMNGSTTERAQGACPTGFHIPSDCEWMYLEHGQGMLISQQTTNNSWRSSGNVSGKLSTLTRATSASANGTGTNSSGFTALLAGNRLATGTFINGGTSGDWRSSSLFATNSMARNVNSSQASVYRYGNNKASGSSVRCLKD